MRRFRFALRAIAALLTVVLLLQSSGAALAADAQMGLHFSQLSLSMQIASALQSLRATRIAAMLTGNADRWNAMHAPAPVFPRETPHARVNTLVDRHEQPVFHSGIFRSGPPMLDRRLRPDERSNDPRAMSHGANNGSRCAFALHLQPCSTSANAGTAASVRAPIFSSPPTIVSTSRLPGSILLPAAARAHAQTRTLGIRTMSVNPTVNAFQYEADSMSAPTTLFYPTTIESGAISRTMVSAPTDATTSETLTYKSDPTGHSWGWVSPANVPNLTSWPAQTYNVTLNITSPNSNLTITEVKIYRVDSNGGPSTSGLAVVGDLAGLSQSLGTGGTLSFSVAGSAQTANATDRVAVKFYVLNSASTTQSFSYSAGQNSGSGMNLVQPLALEADTTAAPSALFYTISGESGAVSQIMDQSPTNAAATETLSYTGSGSGTWGWVSAANAPNLTEWPAGNYTVTLNITQPNSNIYINEVRIYRVDAAADGGTNHQGLAVVGDLKGIKQYLSAAGTLTFTVPGDAQTASSTDRLGVKFSANNAAATTQSFGYSAGQNSGSGINLFTNTHITTSTTGINRWWTYEEGALPGHGKYMVNVGNGNLLVQDDDVDIPERGIDLAFRRTYNSQSTHDSNNTDGSVPSNYGEGWTNTFDAHLAYDGSNTISVYDIDGARYDYTADGAGGWTPPPGQHATLTWDGSCGYQWTEKSGTTYYFYSPDLNETANCNLTTVGTFPQDTAYGGRLYKIWARNSNNYITFTYAWTSNATSAANLSEIDANHADGHTLKLSFASFSGYNELASITRPDGQVIKYSYDSSGDLTDVCDVGNGNSDNSPNASAICGDSTHMHHRYGWNTPGSHQMLWADSPKWTMAWGGTTADGSGGGYVNFSYNSSNQATGVQQMGYGNFTPNDVTNSLLQPSVASGNQQISSTTFTYSSGQTQLTDTNGHATTWLYDNEGRETETEDYTGSLWLISYASWDSSNNLIATRDPRSSSSTDTTYETDYAYDSNGNTIAVALPSTSVVVNGSTQTFRPTSLYSYDSSNNVVAYCDPVKVGSVGYDWTNRPQSDSLCAVGTGATGATQYVWNHSDASEPYGYLTDTYTPLGYHHTITYAPSSEGGGDYGLPTQVQGASYTQNDGTTRQPTQTFAYNSYGDLTSYNKGNGAWSLTYDVSTNRLTARTDPDNVTSRTCYFNNGQVQATQTALQYKLDNNVVCGPNSATFAYDADGDVTSQTNHINNTADTTTKWYDGEDRLVEVKLPYDQSDAFQNPWITRYMYDLTQGGTVTLSGSTSVSYKAYGNLYKTQELLAPGTSEALSWYRGNTKIANTQFQDINGTGFDALDRPTAKYQFVSDAPKVETMTYDGSGYSGLLTGHCNAVSQCSTLTYYQNDAVEKATYSDSTPSETHAYDPDGRVGNIASSSFGTQYYNYDADGRLTSEIEPNTGGVTSNATITYHYYGDGMRSSLDVSSSGLNQTSLFAYSYRADGMLQQQQINDSADSLVGSSALAFTYSSAGRLTNRSESGPIANSTAVSFTYDSSTGVTATANYPSAALSGFSYDADGELQTFNQNIYNYASGSVGNFTRTVRGELLHDPRATGTVAFANGTLIAGTNSSNVSSWDARSGRIAGNGSPYFDQNGNTTGVNFSYDNAGRQTLSDQSGSDHYGFQYDITNGRSYDAEDHVTSASQDSPDTYKSANYTTSLTAYEWGPNGHPIRIGSTPSVGNAQAATSQLNYDTLHWDGDQLLFTTNSQGQVDDIKIGAIGDITPLDSGYAGLTFYDRVAGSIAFCHNATGASGSDRLPSTHSSITGTSMTVSPCAKIGTQAMSVPASVIYWGDARLAGGVGQGKVLGLSGTDGIADGVNIIQGVRTYDPLQGQWTTPDAYAGEVHDPMSQKSYVWNRNDAIQYADPSGYDSGLFYDANPQSGGAIQDAPDLGQDDTGAVAYSAHSGQLSPTTLLWAAAFFAAQLIDSYNDNDAFKAAVNQSGVTLIDAMQKAMTDWLGPHSGFNVSVSGGSINLQNTVGNSVTITGNWHGASISENIGKTTNATVHVFHDDRLGDVRYTVHWANGVRSPVTSAELIQPPSRVPGSDFDPENVLEAVLRAYAHNEQEIP